MNKSQELLSNIVVYSKYAKYIPEKKRRESWQGIVDRYVTMMVKKYGTEDDVKNFFIPYGLPAYSLHDRGSLKREFSPIVTEIIMQSEKIYKKKILPSMRALQFAGRAIERNHSRLYNCSYLPINSYHAFSETMFLLLGGSGVGYSVQEQHISQLPAIKVPAKSRKYVIGDSIEGWADAVKALVKSYFGLTKSTPNFDFSDIREKGSMLVTSGGKAPGPEPLKRCLMEVEFILQRKKDGERLTSLDCHDILCHIADAVLAGGIRRAAMISLFSPEDKGMLSCKSGSWWELNPQRARANNSVVLVRDEFDALDVDDAGKFVKIWNQVKDSNAGEPGIYWTNDKEWGTNPCCEIALREFTFCNLCEVNAGLLESKEDFFFAASAAAFFGTLQAGFTDFHYLRAKWKDNTEEDALIGVGITGIANGNLLDLIYKEPSLLSDVAHRVKQINAVTAKQIGINEASRCTTIKPSGNSSCVLGVSSGIHAWHDKYYIRNMQCRVGDDLYNFFNEYHPELLTIMEYDPESAVIATPQVAPDNAVLRSDETAFTLLNRIMLFNKEWVRNGHRKGKNFNNVSATVSIKKHEWDSVGLYLWSAKDEYNGISVLPYDGGSYKNAPYEVATKEEINKLTEYIDSHNILLTLIKEDDDNTAQADNVACAGGSCELTF